MHRLYTPGHGYRFSWVRWSRPGCPELVAGSGKQVIVMVMATSIHGNLSRMGHMIMW